MKIRAKNSMMSLKTSFDSFAEIYDQVMDDTGDYTHRNTIDPAFFKAIKEIKNKVIYDMACGNGYLARRMVKEGAKEVWASDISPTLVKIAQKYENPGGKIKYLVCDARDFKEVPKNYFDIATMNMAIHYLDLSHLENFFKGVASILKPGGHFIFTTEHPLRKLAMMDAKGEQGPTLERVINSARDYISIKERVDHNVWTGEEDLRIYHAPIGHYIDLLAKNSLLVDVLVEPVTKVVIDDVSNPTPVFSNIPAIIALGAKRV
jgi:ubiquinone/menaquinone biosynthesis C-methylase UbiE